MLLGNFLPLFGDDSHNLLGVEGGLLSLDHFSALLRKKQVGTQGFSRWLSILLEFAHLLFDVHGEEMSVEFVPEFSLGALLEWL